MRIKTLLLFALSALGACTRPATPTTSAAAGPADYFPSAGAEWRHQAPRAAGFDSARLAAAVAFA